MTFDQRIGAESLQLAVFRVLHENINTYLGDEQAVGNVNDVEIATVSGQPLVQVSLELVDPRYIHYGHRPSMIEAPVTEYPSVSVMAYIASPAGTNINVDYGHSVSLKVAIEMIVKSGPYQEDDRMGEGEDIVGRRIKRTAEAVHRLMMDHQSLGGAFEPPEVAPTVTWGDIFARDEDGETSTGNRWYWQGVRMEYTYLKQTVFSQ